MNVATFVWGEHPSSNYRSFHPMAELARHGHVIAMYTEPGQLTPSDEELETIVREFDVAIIVRYSGEEAQALAQRLKDAGIALVWDYDDDVVSEEFIARVTAMSQLVDVVTTTNDLLADRYLEKGARAVVAIPNYVTRRAAETPRRKHDGTVLGYIGWIDHQDDWDQLGLEEIVRELLDVHTDLRVESVGPIDLRLPPDRYHRTDAIPFEELPGAIAGFDIAIAPLVEKPGNDTRSNIKLKEYAIAGVPWLASPLGPYLGLGEEEGGRLVADDAWFDELHRLISDPRGRRKLAKRGMKWGHEQTLERNVGIWEDALEEAIELAQERSTV